MNEKSTKEKIFEAAINLFETKGYHGASMRDLAKEVGIKESSLYNHYSGKSAILEAILDFHLKSFHEALPTREEMDNTEIYKTDPVDIWINGVMDYMKKLPPQTEKISKILTNEMYINVKCHEFVLTTLFKFQKDTTEFLMKDLQTKGLLKECDIRKEAVQYVYMLHGLRIENRLLAMNGAKPEDLQKKLIEHITFFIERLKK